MVAGRRAPDGRVEGRIARHTLEDSRSASILKTPNKLQSSSVACLEAIRNQSSFLLKQQQRRASHVDTYHKLTVVFSFLLVFLTFLESI